MIARVWSAQALPEREAEYVGKVREVVLPRLRSVPGYVGAHFLRRPAKGLLEILVITYWESMEAVKSLTAGEPEKAYVPGEIAATLEDFDAGASHYEVLIEDHVAPGQPPKA